jgi:hypothetical protein
MTDTEINELVFKMCEFDGLRNSHVVRDAVRLIETQRAQLREIQEAFAAYPHGITERLKRAIIGACEKK